MATTPKSLMESPSYPSGTILTSTSVKAAHDAHHWRHGTVRAGIDQSGFLPACMQPESVEVELDDQGLMPTPIRFVPCALRTSPGAPLRNSWASGQVQRSGPSSKAVQHP